jgi:hypothetical protein
MIFTTYNQYVRPLSSEPFGWFSLPKLTRAWEPTLLWNPYTPLRNGRRALYLTFWTTEVCCTVARARFSTMAS